VRQACWVLLFLQGVQVKHLESLFRFAVKTWLLDRYLGGCDGQAVAGIFAGDKRHQNVDVLDLIILSLVLRPKIFGYYCNLCDWTLVECCCTNCCFGICICWASNSVSGTLIVSIMWPNRCREICATSQAADVFAEKNASLNWSFSVDHVAFLALVVFIVALGRDYFLTVNQTSLFRPSPFVIVDGHFIFITTKVTDCDLCIGLDRPVLNKLRYTVLEFWLFSPASRSKKEHHASSHDYQNGWK